MRTARGLFLVFEGGDGVGKSTQAERLCEHLSERGVQVVRTYEPGDTAVGSRIRQLVLDPATGHLFPRAEALLYAADKAQHVAAVVLPALRRGAAVVCDRYVDSMLAYQGAGRMLDLAEVEVVARWATQDLRPDLTVLLDADPEVTLAGKPDLDRLEASGADFHARVRELFLQLAAREPELYLVLPGRASRDAIARSVADRVADLLPGPVSDPAGRLAP
jgi:dTMP kinase